MTTYTDDEIREALLRAEVATYLYIDNDRAAEAHALTLRWLATEYPRLKADAEKWREWDEHNYAVTKARKS